MSLRILVVCEGNVCRSPLAERLLARRLPEAAVSSAGTRAPVGAAMHPLTAAQLTRLGGDATGFAARALTQEDVVAADLVLTATKAVRAAVVEVEPRALRRTFTLLEFAALLDRAPSGPTGPTVEQVDTTTQLIGWASAHRTLVADEPLDGTGPDRWRPGTAPSGRSSPRRHGDSDRVEARPRLTQREGPEAIGAAPSGYSSPDRR